MSQEPWIPLESYQSYTSESESGPELETYQNPVTVIQGRPVVQPENRLINELSPYLQQHAHNPVAWYPWGPEAFAAAQRENKPIFLSIGFSACHWCHVMERECFNDPEVAELMNDACIAIKVDREERPDLDDLFMEVCHIQNGSGGWPLNLFLMPDGRPFFSTTWLPKRTRGQMPGLTDIIPRVKWLWLMQREAITRGAKELAEVITERSKFTSGGSRPRNLKASSMRTAFEILQEKHDPVWGGFLQPLNSNSGANANINGPKFPEPVKLLFLLHQSGLKANSKADQDAAFSMVDLTLRRMWRGGIHDHLGGGFCRYATDNQWIVPHFEKLLADQALLLLVVSLAQELRPNPFYALMAEDIVKSVMRDFSEPDNVQFPHPCFIASIDADNEEGEGGYYLWRDDEIHELLPEGDAGLFCAAYAVMPGGNFGAELAGSQIGYNILYETSSVTQLARRYGLHGPEVSRRLAQDREILLAARSRKPAPPRDNKVLMNWNGLMIGALARASVVFNKPDWRVRAETAALFLQKNLVSLKNVGQGQLQVQKGEWARRWRHGQAGIPALPGDYAGLLWGIMQLCRAQVQIEKAGTKDSVPLPASRQVRDLIKYAEDLADSMIANYWDENSGGLFLSPSSDKNIFLRRKTANDDSLPSANSLAVLGLAELAQAENAIALESASAGNTSANSSVKKYIDLGRKIISCFARSVDLNPMDNLSLITVASLFREIRGTIELEQRRAAVVSVNLKLNDIPADAVSDGEDVSGFEQERTSTAEDAAPDARTQRAQRRAARSGGAADTGSNMENQRRLARDAARRDRTARREHRTQRRGR